MADAMNGFEMDGEEYAALLTKMLAEVKYLQNAPSLGLVANETRIAKMVMAELEPLSKAKGGPLEIELLEYVQGRANLLIKYPGTLDASKPDSCVSFVGSHMDVVPANPEEWKRDPFSATREGDKIYGRGTTDCLGHVAILTHFMKQLAQKKPALKRTVNVLFIASEESSSEDIDVGVDACLKRGVMEQFKNGPMYWIDSADGQPTNGTCGVGTWELTVNGRLFHSGFPNLGINAIELGMRAYEELAKRFHDKFGPHPEEAKYGFSISSSLKVTQVSSSKNSLNQIPPKATLAGDMRVTPFYPIDEVLDFVEATVKDIDSKVDQLVSFSPNSKFTLGEEVGAEVSRGTVTLKMPDRAAMRNMEGVAVDMTSPGYKGIVEATKQVTGSVAPKSITGSLPIVRGLQRAGFDLQMVGYGLSKVYHGIDEYCNISDMQAGYKIFALVIAQLESA